MKFDVAKIKSRNDLSEIMDKVLIKAPYYFVYHPYNGSNSMDIFKRKSDAVLFLIGGDTTTCIGEYGKKPMKCAYFEIPLISVWGVTQFRFNC